MKNPERRRKWLLITEFLALGLLLVAVYALQHFHSANPTSTWIWLLVMAVASLLLFASFLGLTYLGWFSGEGGSLPESRSASSLCCSPWCFWASGCLPCGKPGNAWK